MRLLYLTAEEWPTFRADITVLFGKYLPRFGIHSDLVTETLRTKSVSTWPAGKAITCSVPSNRAAHYIVKFFHQCKVLLTTNYDEYAVVQVRDMTIIALVALMMCAIKKKPFFYWLSYPQSEGQIQRAKARGVCAGMKYWFPLMQGMVGKWLLYKIILPKADHVFVQSDNMRKALMQQNIPFEKMTPVPMGVDLEAIEDKPLPHTNPLLVGKRVLVYLGTLDKTRQIELLFMALKLVMARIPNVLLVLAGDTEDDMHRAWLKQQATQHGVESDILWTGWLPTKEAWRYVVSAEVGLSPFPRGFLLDMASPTKAVEYMALGLPVIANDNPDQQQVVAESGAGMCVPMTPEAFADAIATLLNDSNMRANMSSLGQHYVSQYRGYYQLAESLAKEYQQRLQSKVRSNAANL